MKIIYFLKITVLFVVSPTAKIKVFLIIVRRPKFVITITDMLFQVVVLAVVGAQMMY